MNRSIFRRVFAVLILFSTIFAALPTLFASAEGEIVKDGLVAWYDGARNTRDGHDSTSLVWEDLAGTNDIAVAKNETNYFTEDAYHLKNAQYALPSAIIDLVNGEEFTVEISLGELIMNGTDHAVLLNNINGNDNFSLFLRRSGDYLEFKAGQNSRPKVSGGLEYLKDSTVAITFKLGEKIRLFVDGILIQTKTASSRIGATGSLFFGHANASRSHETDYKSMRFYNRALTEAEIINNAEADGTSDYVRPPQFARVSQPTTNIVGDICLSEFVESGEELRAIVASGKAANAIFYVDSSLSVTDSKYENGYETLEGVIAALDERMIPTFYVADEESATMLAAALDKMQVSDAFVMSDSPSAVLAARTENAKLRGIIDFQEAYADSEIGEAELIEIRKTATKNLAKVAVLPASGVTREDVKYLNSRQITTWLLADEPLTEGEAMRLLVSETYGIISEDAALLLEVAEEHLCENSLTRTPLIIAHRGLPYELPENTVASCLAAYAVGADVMEIDVYMTTDGVLVLNHDGTTTGFDKVLNVEEHSYAELRALTLTHNGTEYKINTLDELLSAFSELDCMIFIELKSRNAGVVPEVKRLVEAYGMYDRCAVIAFPNNKQFENMREYYPEMPVGYLTSNEYGGFESLSEIQSTINAYNATFNPKALGYDAAFVREATLRGITSWPWTVNGTSEQHTQILYGHAGITTDRSERVRNLAERISLATPERTLYKVGESLSLGVIRSTFGGESAPVDTAELIILEGDAVIENGALLFTGSGSVTVIARLTEAMSGTPYSLYSEPMTLLCESESVTPPEGGSQTPPEGGSQTPPEGGSQTPPDGNETPGDMESLAVWIAVGVTALLLLSAVAVTVTVKKKKAK